MRKVDYTVSTLDRSKGEGRPVSVTCPRYVNRRQGQHRKMKLVWMERRVK